MKILITGGAGFIGSALTRFYAQCHPSTKILIIDNLTYSGSKANLKALQNYSNVEFADISINNFAQITTSINKFQPDTLFHLAAESHVDNSINSPRRTIETNIVGTFNLLEACRNAQQQNLLKSTFKFIHVSTDEVYGALNSGESAFTIDSQIKPNSPYSASKAASDHLARAWHITYKLPVIITHCSNNYGPYQFPEKLIPKTIANALSAQAIPVYGQGLQVRDWLHVDDHIQALHTISQSGTIGEVYNIGGKTEISNIDLVTQICSYLDTKAQKYKKNMRSFSELITFVEDRKGHDFRYAINCELIEQQLSWSAKINFQDGLTQTIDWYLNHLDWIEESKGLTL